MDFSCRWCVGGSFVLIFSSRIIFHFSAKNSELGMEREMLHGLSLCNFCCHCTLSVQGMTPEHTNQLRLNSHRRGNTATDVSSIN